ncbi:MAG: glycosyltransferase family 4 protein [Treponema sp.]|nr:glycosyltransferase family 4 protein [Treponema sp.]
MKVGIDTFGCDNGRSGLGAYLMSLVPSLPIDKGIEFELFGPEIDRYTYNGDKSFNFSSVKVPDSLALERLWHAFKVNSFGKKMNYDIILYPAGSRILPVNFKIKSVAVINDIVSNLFKNIDDSWYRRRIRKGLCKVDCIIAVSEYIRKDLEASGITCSNIQVIHNGIDHSRFYPGNSIETDSRTVDIKPFAIKKPYLIYASRLADDKKKHIELIRAFTLFKQRTHLPHRLVLAGSEGSYGSVVHKEAGASSASSDIFITGYFPHNYFPELYHNADACIFPSVTEGVGLSVMESMACGLPVACSSSGALREIAGDNALYFDSDNIEDFASAIERIVTDTELRTRLSEGGIAFAKKFSWQQTAEKTVELLKSVYEK